MRKRILPIVFCILILLFSALPVFAAETGIITVMFEHEKRPVADASFFIYKAAEWNGSEYTLTGPFSGYPVKMADDPNSEEWKAIASTLSAYATREKTVPLASHNTDKEGTLRFEGLSDGLYLLLGNPVESGDVRLFPQPMLVAVPYTTANGEKDYEVVTEPKYEFRKITEKTFTRRALKIWRDEGNESGRPQEITVQLLCDGKIYAEQALNAANNWTYTWEDLDATHDWQLIEKAVPDDYTVAVTRQGITFTVTNTNDNPPPPPPEQPTLPQTGLLWWPVPLLAGAGSVSLFFGIFLLLRGKDGSNA